MSPQIAIRLSSVLADLSRNERLPPRMSASARKVSAPWVSTARMTSANTAGMMTSGNSQDTTMRRLSPSVKMTRNALWAALTRPREDSTRVSSPALLALTRAVFGMMPIAINWSRWNWS